MDYLEMRVRRYRHYMRRGIIVHDRIEPRLNLGMRGFGAAQDEYPLGFTWDHATNTWSCTLLCSAAITGLEIAPRRADQPLDIPRDLTVAITSRKRTVRLRVPFVGAATTTIFKRDVAPFAVLARTPVTVCLTMPAMIEHDGLHMHERWTVVRHEDAYTGRPPVVPRADLLLMHPLSAPDKYLHIPTGIIVGTNLRRTASLQALAERPLLMSCAPVTAIVAHCPSPFFQHRSVSAEPCVLAPFDESFVGMVSVADLWIAAGRTAPPLHVAVAMRGFGTEDRLWLSASTPLAPGTAVYVGTVEKHCNWQVVVGTDPLPTPPDLLTLPFAGCAPEAIVEGLIEDRLRAEQLSLIDMDPVDFELSQVHCLVRTHQFDLPLKHEDMLADVMPNMSVTSVIRQRAGHPFAWIVTRSAFSVFVREAVTAADALLVASAHTAQLIVAMAKRCPATHRHTWMDRGRYITRELDALASCDPHHPVVPLVEMMRLLQVVDGALENIPSEEYLEKLLENAARMDGAQIVSQFVEDCCKHVPQVPPNAFTGEDREDVRVLVGYRFDPYT